MARFVIDPSVLLGIAEGTVDICPEHQLVAPGSLRSQAESMLYEAVRSGRLDRDIALERLERLAEIKVRLLNDRVSRRVAWRLAEELGLEGTHQAEYLAVAQLQADALVTRDDELVQAARGVVEVAGLDALGRP